MHRRITQSEKRILHSCLQINVEGICLHAPQGLANQSCKPKPRYCRTITHEHTHSSIVLLWVCICLIACWVNNISLITAHHTISVAVPSLDLGCLHLRHHKTVGWVLHWYPNVRDMLVHHLLNKTRTMTRYYGYDHTQAMTAKYIALCTSSFKLYAPTTSNR